MARKQSLTSPATPMQTSAPSPITPRLVTIKQAAAYCSCAVWAIRQAIVLAQREMEKRRSPLVYRFRPDGRGFSRHFGVYRPMTRSGQCTAQEGKLSRC
jgi:hypothetical protein